MNIWGWLVVLGSVGSSVGLVVYGMGTSTLEPASQLIDYGKILMLGGLLALVIGLVAYKATEKSSSS